MKGAAQSIHGQSCPNPGPFHMNPRLILTEAPESVVASTLDPGFLHRDDRPRGLARRATLRRAEAQQGLDQPDLSARGKNAEGSDE
jgi:hypothetical protein